MRKGIIRVAFGLSMLGTAALPAAADDTIKIGYVDPLSGGAASIGQIGLNQLKFIADGVNAKGGVIGKKIEIIGYDNKVNPQITLVQLQKAIDEGVRIIVQGNGSSVGAAVEDFVTKYNERNPGKEVIYLNYAAIDPALTNAKCSYWHFAFDANSDIKMEALTNFIKPLKDVKKVYLIDQDYSFGHSVADAAVRMLKAKRPDIEIVGNEFHPLVKITDFSPYIAKIKASGADSVITGNWGQDFALLIKAAGDAGLAINWYTYYAGGAGGPTAIKQANAANRVYQIVEGFDNLGFKPSQDITRAYRARFSDSPVYYPRIFNLTGMLFKAIEEAHSDDPVKIAAKLEGMKFPTYSSGDEGYMRKDDHQFFQPIYIADFGPRTSTDPFDEEHSDWGWKLAAQIPVNETILPTTCNMNRPS
jgi:branched-chain amino acid transport system substrate-binding protein